MSIEKPNHPGSFTMPEIKHAFNAFDLDDNKCVDQFRDIFSNISQMNCDVSPPGVMARFILGARLWPAGLYAGPCNQVTGRLFL